MWDKIWEIANSNLVILLFGSGMGFLFIKLGWEPYKKRTEKESRRRAIREETAFRLMVVETSIANNKRYIVHELDGLGDEVHALDPVYRNWSIDGLIFAGWGNNTFRECY